MLILKKPRMDFGIVFNNFLKSYTPIVHTPYGCFWDEFDTDWDDDYLNYINDGLYNFGNGISYGKPSKKSKSKNRSRYKSYGKNKSSKNNLGRYNDIHSYKSYDDYDDDYDDMTSSFGLGCDAKTIFFYKDINNPDDYEEFYNLFSFDDYLRNNGIQITDYETQKILNRDISHCTVINKDGEPWLVSDHNYGSLYYEASECLYD